MIPVTKPFLPPIELYNEYIKSIWEREYLTNNGPLVLELESKLKNYLGIKNLLYLTNGTIALQIAIKALNITGEIITTPFSYVATTSSIVWEGCKPVFVDIDSKSLNIDANKIENAITSKTQAILATHCFGVPCDVEAIDIIAKKHNLKIIYDAAHCFGTKFKGESIFNWGDISTTSFHATKIFHTIEGGAVFSSNSLLIKKMSLLRNFGHDGPEKFSEVGINGKNSEFHAAMGLSNLIFIDSILEKRKAQNLFYDQKLCFEKFRKIEIQNTTDWNYSYYPIIFNDEAEMLRLKAILEFNEIFPRRYFYPSLSKLKYVEGKTEISDDIADKILCLPLYNTLSFNQIELITNLINTQ